MLSIAIVGLGRVGTGFLKEILGHGHQGLKVLWAAEPQETEGKELARRSGVRLLAVEDIIGMGQAVDIIFDFTGQAELRRQLRQAMADTANRHTVVASEVVGRLVWSLITDKPVPELHVLEY